MASVNAEQAISYFAVGIADKCSIERLKSIWYFIDKTEHRTAPSLY
ncbi:hypothetical protein [Agarivorans sp. QJM3NY_33]